MSCIDARHVTRGCRGTLCPLGRSLAPPSDIGEFIELVLAFYLMRKITLANSDVVGAAVCECGASLRGLPCSPAPPYTLPYSQYCAWHHPALLSSNQLHFDSLRQDL